MTTPAPASSDSPVPPTPPRRLFNPRVILILLLLLAVICASVILTDHFSVRDRNAGAPPAPNKGPRP